MNPNINCGFQLVITYRSWPINVANVVHSCKMLITEEKRVGEEAHGSSVLSGRFF